MDEQKKRPWLQLPGIGARTVKTIASVALVAMAYGLLGQNPCFACIGAVYGMGSTFRGGLQSGGNRFLGTAIGGLFVIPFYWLTRVNDWPVPDWIWLALGCFCVLYVSQMFGALGAIQPGTVVFFVVMATVTEDRYISYTLARIMDTCIGVLVSLAISKLLPSKKDVEELNRRAAEALEAAELADSRGDCARCNEKKAQADAAAEAPVPAAQTGESDRPDLPDALTYGETADFLPEDEPAREQEPAPCGCDD